MSGSFGDAPRGGEACSRAGAAAGGRPERIELGALDRTAAAELPLRLAGARLVCFPTDTVYGIGGVLSPASVAAVIAAKGRDEDKPLQVVFPNRELLLSALSLGAQLTDVCLRLLPGPVTLVLPYPEDFVCPPPGEVAHEERRPFGGRRRVVVRTLGVRVPRWPAPAHLLETLPFPLVASSANRSGAPAPAALGEVDPAMLAACDVALDGGPAGGMASSVVDFSRYAETGRWRVLREGAWSTAELVERLTRRRDDLPQV